MLTTQLSDIKADLAHRARGERARKAHGYLLAHTGWQAVPGGNVARLNYGQWESAKPDDALTAVLPRREEHDETAEALIELARDAAKAMSGGSTSPDLTCLPAAKLTPDDDACIAFLDAVYDMRTFARTGESLPYYHAAAPFPGTPDSWETHDDTRRLLTGVFGSVDTARHVGTLVGAAMLGPSVKPQKAIYLVGGGGTGKSLLIELLSELLGQSATNLASAAFSTHSSTDRAHSRLGTEGKRLAFVNEFPHGSFDVEYFKSLTGGDIVRGRALYQAPREWRSECTPMFVSNELPALNGEKSSLLRRMIVVDCASRLPEALRLGRLSASRRHAIVHQLGQWIADGAHRALADGGIKAACEAVSSTAAVMDETDSFLAWATGVRVFQLGEEPDGMSFSAYGSKRDSLWDGYVEHCRRGGFQRLTRPQFFRRLREMGAQPHRVVSETIRGRWWNVHVYTEQELNEGAGDVEEAGEGLPAVSAREAELMAEIEVLRARLAGLEAIQEFAQANRKPARKPARKSSQEATQEGVRGSLLEELSALEAVADASDAAYEKAFSDRAALDAELQARFGADDEFLRARADADHEAHYGTKVTTSPSTAQQIIGTPKPLAERPDDSLPAITPEERGGAYIPLARP